MASLFDLLGGDKETSRSIVGSLFGLSPELVAQQQAQQNLQGSQATAMQYAQLDPMQRAQYAIFQGGSGAASGLMGAIGPESAAVQRAKQEAVLKDAMAKQGITLDNPQGYMAGAKLAMDMGLPDVAAKLGMAGAQLDKEMATAAKARRVDTGELVDQGLYAAALREANNDPIKAAQLYNERRQAEKRSVAAAGVPAPGMVKLPDLATAKDIVTGYVKPYQDKLTAIGVAGTNLKEAYTNPQAVPQLRQALTTLTGKDNQTSAKELAGILGSMGLAGNIVESINTVLTGKPTKEVLDNAGRAIQALENYYGTQYNAARQQGAGVLSQARLSPETQNVILPKEYKLPEQKKQTTGKKTISFSDLPQ